VSAPVLKRKGKKVGTSYEEGKNVGTGYEEEGEECWHQL
jgi:hypothetical protein